MDVLPHPDSLSWTCVTVAAICIGLTKAGFSGFSLLAILMMAQVYPAKESTGVVVPMLILADLMAIGMYRRHVVWTELWRLIPTTVLGLLGGWVLLDRIPGAVFGQVLGWMILAMMFLLLWQRIDQRVLKTVLAHPALTGFSGFAAGVTTMMANAGGPAMTFYLLARNFDKMAFVGTCAWFFFFTNLAKVPLSLGLGLITRSSLLVDLLLLPAIALGMITGRLLLGRVSQSLFEILALIMAALSSLRLILG
jgi:uncharacterized protein